MIVVDDPSALPAALGGTAVTIGKFDGVHEGHRRVIAALRREAAENELASVVLTFDRNPLAFLRPEACPPSLGSLARKLELLEAEGVDAVVVARFDERFASLTAEQFVARILRDDLRARAVLVGPDFRFGAGGAGDLAALERMSAAAGFRVVQVPGLELGADRISSSKVRAALDRGDVQEATGMLGRPPSMRGVVVPGLRRGRELGFPTANLSPDADGFAPADGVYAGWLVDRTSGMPVRHPSAISVGTNPTFDDVAAKQVEAHVLDADLDLYGHEVEIVFVRRLRGMVAYSGREPLIAQMRQDVEEARRVLSSGTGPSTEIGTAT